MTGIQLVIVGMFFVVIGAARRFIGRPQAGAESTGFSRGDFIGGTILIGGGLAFLAAGLILMALELLT